MNILSVEVTASAVDPGLALFRLKGHLDAQTVRDLESRFDQQIKAARVRWIVDLEELEYISSAGLGSFVGVLSELRSQGGDIFFIGLTQKMEKIFKVLGFTRIFKVFPSEAEAANAFKGA
jgi:anti-sigma B factor antagonist